MYVQINIAAFSVSQETLPLSAQGWPYSSHICRPIHDCLQGHSQDILQKIPNSDHLESSEGPSHYVLCLWKRPFVWSYQGRSYSMVVKSLDSGPQLCRFKSQLLHCWSCNLGHNLPPSSLQVTCNIAAACWYLTSWNCVDEMNNNS